MVGKTKTDHSKIILAPYNMPVNPVWAISSVKVISTLGLQAIRWHQFYDDSTSTINYHHNFRLHV